jgi:hypothetical protein
MSKFSEGTWIVQNHSTTPIYALVTGSLKNGCNKVIQAGGWAGTKAAQKSTSGWYPVPQEIDKNDIPEKFIKAIEKKIK